MDLKHSGDESEIVLNQKGPPLRLQLMEELRALLSAAEAAQSRIRRVWL